MKSNNDSCGHIASQLIKLGMKQSVARKFQKEFWRIYDNLHPPTVYEKGFLEFVKGKNKGKRNYTQYLIESGF